MKGFGIERVLVSSEQREGARPGNLGTGRHAADTRDWRRFCNKDAKQHAQPFLDESYLLLYFSADHISKAVLGLKPSGCTHTDPGQMAAPRRWPHDSWVT